MKKISGYLMSEDLVKVLREVKDVSGAIAEVGVYKGKLFNKLALFGGLSNKQAHAFDSFEGMDKPGEYDRDRYRQGACNCGGVEAFKEIMHQYGFSDKEYIIHQGFVPDCFPEDNQRYSFVYIDLDHYSPTVKAIEYFHPRIVNGGILGFDDFYAKNDLASRAIKEFIESQLSNGYIKFLHTDNHQVFFTKQAGGN